MKEHCRAIIDFGSNTVNLAVYDIQNGRFKKVFKQNETLGIIVFIENGVLSEEGINRSIQVLKKLKDAASWRAAKTFAFATASLRGLKNADEVSARLSNESGLDIDVLTAEKEAFYDYAALRFAIPSSSALAADIGGGSTELVWMANGRLEKNYCIPTGTLKLYRDFVHGFKPTAEEQENIKKCAESYMRSCRWLKNTGCDSVYTIGGTARAIVKLHAAIRHLSPEEADYTYDTAQIPELISFAAAPENHHYISLILPDRAHTILPGLILLQEIAKASGAIKALLLNFGVREGYLIENILKSGET